MLRLGTGHAFLILLGNAFPINVLPAVRAVQEVCGIYCATANSVEVIVAETDQGRAILGVADGVRSRGIEGEAEIAERKQMLRRFGYKAS
jgi:adenosine/AMP kinase